jgi:hypothetical protein
LTQHCLLVKPFARTYRRDHTECIGDRGKGRIVKVT